MQRPRAIGLGKHRMDYAAYDRRDARQAAWAYLGFAMLSSWTIWGALWAPGIQRWPTIEMFVAALGTWGAAVAAKAAARASRPGAVPPVQDENPERTPKRCYLQALVIAGLCAGSCLALSLLLGFCGWEWRWEPSGSPLVYVYAGQLLYVPVAAYDVVNYLLLALQTAVVGLYLFLVAFLIAAGGEIGWRGAFAPLLVRTGRKPLEAALLSGLLWGVWLWPLAWHGDATGYYPGHPWWGMLLSVLHATAWGSVLAWLRFRTGRVGPAITAAACLMWLADKAPLVATDFNPLLAADARSLLGTAVIAAVAAALWRFTPPPAIGHVNGASFRSSRAKQDEEFGLL